MRIREDILNKFNAGLVSIYMEICTKEHYEKLFSHILEKKEYIQHLYGFSYIHKRKDGAILGWMTRPQDKDSIHFSQIWEDEEMPQIELESLFYVFLPGKQTPQVQYTLYSEAQKEAERLCKKEKQIAYVCEVRIIVEPSDEVKITYR